MTTVDSRISIRAGAAGNWSQRNTLRAALAILFMTMIAYVQAMQNGYVSPNDDKRIQNGYIWDDDAHVYDNPNLQNVAGLVRIWTKPRATPQYYPVVHTTFWMEYQLWGLYPLGYHIVNVLLHGCNAIMVFLVLRRMKIPGGDAAAWLAGAIFALHPVHVESVAWITERKNVLSGLFYLLSLAAAIRVWALDREKPAEKLAGWAYLACIGCFVLALLSKSVTASLPAVILLLVWWRRGTIKWREIVQSLPLFVIGLIAGLNTAYMELEHVGAKGGTWNFSRVDRVLIAGRAACKYFTNIVWPNPLVFFYERWKVDAGQWWQYLYPVGVVVALVLLWAFRKRIGRGPLTAALFFLGTLFPALGFLNVFPFRYSFVADHFQYLASLGIIVAGACLLVKAGHRLRPWVGKHTFLLQAFPAVILVVLALLTWRESFKYRNQFTLWTDTLEKNSTAAIAYNNLGSLRQKFGITDGAIEYYNKTLELDPRFYEAYINLGTISLVRGQNSQAEGFFRKSIEIEPTLAPGLHGLGMALIREDQASDAIPYLAEAVHFAPARGEYFFSLGVALVKVEKYDVAEKAFKVALELKPEIPETHLTYGRLLCGLGRMDQGIHELQEAVRLRPGWTEALDDLKAAQAVRNSDAARAAATRKSGK